MDEKPDQIIGHIEAQRDQLGRNLDELETRVRASTNWRTYYERNPMVAVGAALGGGLLLGVVLSNTRHSSGTTPRASATRLASRPQSVSSPGYSSGSPASSMVSSPVTTLQRRQIHETFDHVKAALIAFGIAKTKEFLSQAIPGLEHHLNDAEQRGRQHSTGSGARQPWQSPGSPQERESSAAHSWESAGATHQEPVPAM